MLRKESEAHVRQRNDATQNEEKMKEQLYINNILASSYGIRMGDGFLDKLLSPCELKEFVTNESRLENGTRYITSPAKIKARSLSLSFNIHGDSEAEYKNNKAWLFNIFYSGRLELSVRNESNDIFRLVYTGKSVTYGEDMTHLNGKVTAGFDEPDPTDRSQTSIH